MGSRGCFAANRNEMDERLRFRFPSKVLQVNSELLGKKCVIGYEWMGTSSELDWHLSRIDLAAVSDIFQQGR